MGRCLRPKNAWPQEATTILLTNHSFFYCDAYFLIVVFISDLDKDQCSWRVDSLFLIVSDLIENENDAAKIIAKGFRIFQQVTRTVIYDKRYNNYDEQEEI